MVSRGRLPVTAGAALRLFRRGGGLRLPEAADALADGYAAFLRRGPCGPEPTPEVMRLVRERGGGDVLWDVGDRRWRYRDARDVG